MCEAVEDVRGGDGQRQRPHQLVAGARRGLGPPWAGRERTHPLEKRRNEQV